MRVPAKAVSKRHNDYAETFVSPDLRNFGDGDPKRALIAAVVLRAMEEYVDIRMDLKQGGISPTKRANLEEKIADLDFWWFKEDAGFRQGSLQWCCDRLGLESDLLRERIREICRAILRRRKKFRRELLWAMGGYRNG